MEPHVWIYAIMKTKKRKHLTQERGDIYHVCEGGANNWASNHPHTIDIDGGWSYIGQCTTTFKRFFVGVVRLKRHNLDLSLKVTYGLQVGSAKGLQEMLHHSPQT